MYGVDIAMVEGKHATTYAMNCPTAEADDISVQGKV